MQIVSLECKFNLLMHSVDEQLIIEYWYQLVKKVQSRTICNVDIVIILNLSTDIFELSLNT